MLPRGADFVLRFFNGGAEFAVSELPHPYHLTRDEVKHITRRDEHLE